MIPNSPREWADRTIDTLAELALFCGGSADSFTGKLLKLMVHADYGNRARLAAAFPAEELALVLWGRLPFPPTFGQLAEAWKLEAPPGWT